MMSIFTLKTAMEYALNGDIETWVHLFLHGEGDNLALSDGLKKQQRYWVGPIEVEINRLDRVVGPELHMEYVEQEDWWNYKTDQICKRMKDGWDMPPLIAYHTNGILSVRDGNHRLGALEKLGKDTVHVIIWDDFGLENIWWDGIQDIQALGAVGSLQIVHIAGNQIRDICRIRKISID